MIKARVNQWLSPSWSWPIITPNKGHRVDAIITIEGNICTHSNQELVNPHLGPKAVLTHSCGPPRPCKVVDSSMVINATGMAKQTIANKMKANICQPVAARVRMLLMVAINEMTIPTKAPVDSFVSIPSPLPVHASDFVIIIVNFLRQFDDKFRND